MSISEEMGRKIGAGILLGGQAVASASTLVTGGALALLAYADRTANAVAELHGLSEQSGIAGSALASLRTASDTSGVSLGAIAKLSERLSVTLSKPIDDSRGAGAVLKAIGLNAEQLRAMKPDEQLEAVAKALAGFSDNDKGGKAAAAILLLGKSGAAALPFLNDLAESGRSLIKLTDEQINLSDRFSKEQARTRSELQQLAQAAALQALPALSSFTEALRDTAEAVVGVDAATHTLGQSTAVADFAEVSVKALGFVVDAGDGVIRTFGAVGRFVGGYAAVAGALMRGEVQQAKDIGAEFRADTDALLNAPLFSDRLAARLAQSKVPAAAGAAKPALNFQLPPKATASVADSTRAYDALVRSIVAKTSAAETELAGGEKLTESQRFALQIVTQLAASEGKYTDAQKIAAGALLSTYVATQQTVEQRVKQIAAAEELRKAEAASAAAIDRVADARLGENQSLRDALVEYGLTGDQLERLRVKRLEDALATEQQALAVGRAHDLSEAEAAGLQRNIDLLQQQIDLRTSIAAKIGDDATNPLTGATHALSDYAKTAIEAGTATRQAVAGSINSLEGDLVQSLVTGKGSIKSFVDVALSEFYRLVLVRPALAALTQQLEDLTKAAGASSSSSGFGSIISAIGGFFGGGTTSGGGSGFYVSGASGSASTVGMSLAVGTNYVPRDGLVATLHEGEAVVPKAYNPAAGGAMVTPMRTGASGWGGGNNVTVNVKNEAGDVVQASASKSSNGEIEVLVRKIVRDENGRDLSRGAGPISDGLKARGLKLDAGNPRRN